MRAFIHFYVPLCYFSFSSFFPQQLSVSQGKLTWKWQNKKKETKN